MVKYKKTFKYTRSILKYLEPVLVFKNLMSIDLSYCTIPCFNKLFGSVNVCVDR